MATSLTTEKYHDGDDTRTNFDFPFTYTKESDIKVEHPIGTVLSTGYSVLNGTQIKFDSAPAVGTNNVKIYRSTDVDSSKAVFAAGSSIRAQDLNSIAEHLLFHSQDKVDNRDITNEAVFNKHVSRKAEIEVSKLKDGTARQILQTDAAGTGVEWTSNLDIPGTLDVTGAVDIDSTLNVDGAATFQDNLTINADNKELSIQNNSGSAKFTVDTDNGNTVIAGTLSVTGDSTFSGGVTGNGTTTLSTVDINGGAIDGTTIGANSAGPGTFTNGTIATADINGGNIDGTTIGASSAAAGSFTTVNASGTITGNVTGNITGDLTGKASELADAASVTHSEQSGFTVTDDTYFTTKASDARYYNINSSDDIQHGETWDPTADDKVATCKAIDKRVLDLVDDVGGFYPIANETSFPTHNPDPNDGPGTIISIRTMTATREPTAGVVTIDNGAGTGVTVKIVDCGTDNLPQGFGVLVETTSTLHNYQFHRLTPKATEVTTVAGVTSELSTVAGIASDVTAVAGKETEIGRLGTTDAIADMNLLGTADVVSDMNTLATVDIVSDMNTLATSDVVSDMDTVAGIASNVTTVAGISSNVTTVAGISANVTTVAGKATEVTTVAGKISDVETVSDNITAVENFADLYQIDDFSPSAPTTDGGGNAVAEGDLAYDSTAKRLKVYNGSSWDSGVAGSSDLLNRGGGEMTGNITMAGSQTVDGRDLSVDGAKLDGIEASATADQTAAEIRTLVGNATDSNVFTDADHTKLDGIEASATADQTAAEIRTLVESATDSNVFTDADHTKLNAIEASATADQTDAEIRAAVEAATDSNVFTDADHTKLNAIEASATADQTGAEIKSAYEGEADTNAFTDADHSKLDGIAASANNYVHPNHSGEVTSTADGATVIADDVVDEANLKISNAGSDGQFLKKNSSAGGGLTWDTVTQTDTTYSVSAVDGDDASSEKIRLTAGGSGSGTDDVIIAVGTGLSIARSSDTITLANTVTDTTLTNEAVQDVVGAMFSSNTETGITATYQDDDGTIDLVVASQTDENFTSADHTKLDGIAASANNYVHPNHTGEVTSTADGATVIADDTVDEANLKIDNSPTNDYVLTAKSSAAGGLTWAAAASGTPEGEAVKSTTNSNEAATKFLRADGDGTCSWQVPSYTTNTDTQLTEEQVEDFVGGMLTGNTETGITVTYQDSDGTIDFVVASQTDENFTTADHSKLDGIEASADVTDATNVDAAGAVMNSDLDGKGELLVGDGSGDPSALTVGTNDYVLTADSSEATGVKWAAAASGVTSDGQNNTSAGTDAGAALDADTYRNTLFGKDAGKAINSGDDNVCIGYQAGDAITSASNSVIIGSGAGQVYNAGDDNILIGKNAGYYINGSESNIAIGGNAMSDSAMDADADNNVGIGHNALNSLESGSHNTAVGNSVAGNVTSGTYNVIYGSGAGATITTGSNNICIGPSAGNTLETGSNNIYLGRVAPATAADSANECVVGNANGSDGEITKFKIPGCNFSLKETTATDNYVLTVDSNGDCGWEAAVSGATINNATANELVTVASTTTQLDAEASLTFEDTTSTGLISGKQITGRGFECPATVSDDWTIAAGNNAMFPGPMTVAANKTVTVPANRTLTIV